MVAFTSEVTNVGIIIIIFKMLAAIQDPPETTQTA